MSDKVWIKLRGAQGWGCVCMQKTLPLIEDEMLRLGLIKHSLDVYQWAYNPGRVSKSAGTHDLGGVIDVGQYSLAQRKVWARFGVMMFPRTRQFGWMTGDHGHGVWHDCPHQVPYTDWQVRSGLAGGDGLGSSATLRGRQWRYFEAPKRTWQDALKVETAAAKARVKAASGTVKTNTPSNPKTVKPAAAVGEQEWTDMATKKELEDVVRTVVRQELNKPFAGAWLATFGKGADGKPRQAMQAIRDMVQGVKK